MKSLMNTGNSATAIDHLSCVLSLSPKTIVRHKEATAQRCFQGQLQNIVAVCKWVRSLQDDWEPFLLLQWQSYDETPMKLRVEWRQGELSSQMTKILVIEGQWAILLKGRATYKWLFLQGTYAPCMRAIESVSGPTISAALDSAPRVPREYAELFTHHTRVSKSDDAPSNAVAERIQAAMSGNCPSLLHWRCSAHKGHAIADKTWQLATGVLKGSCAVLLAIQHSQNLCRLLTALETIVRSKLVILKSQELTEGAKQYRSNVMTLYCPKAAPRYAQKTRDSVDDHGHVQWRLANQTGPAHMQRVL